MSPDFIALPRAEIPRPAGAVVVRRRRGDRAVLLSCASPRTGRAFYAIGGNPIAAVYAGIDVGRTQFIVFCISGTIAGFCGYLWVSRYTIAYVEVAGGFELNVIAACVIGGVSIAGGIGTGAAARCSARCSSASSSNALPVIHVSPFWQMAISGVAILGAVVINAGARTPHRPPDPQGSGGGMTEQSPAPRTSSPTGSPAASSWWKRWEVDPGRRGGRHLRLQRARLALFPQPLQSLRRTFNFTEKAIDRLRHGAADHRRRDRPVGRRRSSRSPRPRWALAAQAGAGPPVLVVDRHRRRARLRRLQRLLVTWFGMPSIVVTIGTMSLFRGIAYRHPRRPGLRELSGRLRFLRPGLCLVGGLVRVRAVPGRSPSSSASCCTARASAGASSPSATTRSRRSFPACASTASGSSCSADRPDERHRLGAAHLAHRLDAADDRQGYELEVITMVVLGGVSILGGSGTILGVVIAAFIMGLVTFGLGLLNVPGIVSRSSSACC